MIIDTEQQSASVDDFKKVQEKSIVSFSGIIEDGLKNCRSVTSEGKVYLAEKASEAGNKSLCFDVTVDLEKDGGGENGKYPVGWPRFDIKIDAGQSDLSAYDYFTMNVMIESDRDEISDDNTPAYLIFKSSNKVLKDMNVLGIVEQRQWISIIVPVAEIMKGHSQEECKKFSTVTFGIREREYKNNTSIKFHIGKAGLIKFKRPEIISVKSLETVVLTCESYILSIDIAAREEAKKQNMKLFAEILDADNKKIRSCDFAIGENPRYEIDIRGIAPGPYKLNLVVSDSSGNKVSNVYKKDISVLKSIETP